MEDEELPEVAAYLRSLEGPTAEATPASTTLEQPSQHAQNVASEHLTSSLLQSVQAVMQRAEAEGREASEDELRQIVSRAVIEGVVTGYGMSEQSAQDTPPQRDGDDAKRPRTEGG